MNVITTNLQFHNGIEHLQLSVPDEPHLPLDAVRLPVPTSGSRIHLDELLHIPAPSLDVTSPLPKDSARLLDPVRWRTLGREVSALLQREAARNPILRAAAHTLAEDDGRMVLLDSFRRSLFRG